MHDDAFYGPCDHNEQHGRDPQRSAVEILKRRFAQGEITSKQFKEMLQVLTAAPLEPTHTHRESTY